MMFGQGEKGTVVLQVFGWRYNYVDGGKNLKQS